MIGYAVLTLLLAIPLTMGLIMIAGMLIFMRNPVVDSSNIFNWFRVVAFCAKHPEELLKMEYRSPDRPTVATCPFRYIRDDEYSDILHVRSPHQ